MKAYSELQKMCGIKVGDTVKVLRTAKSFECGWGTIWTQKMNSLVGCNYVVHRESKENGFYLNNSHWFPWFVLEKIKEAPVKEMTVAEISKKLGYEVKIVKE